MHGIRLARGERVRLETPGGGGWGPFAERDGAARARDHAMGYVGANEALKKAAP